MKRLSSRMSHFFSAIVFTGCPERICYKLCVTVFKALHGMVPGYIADLCLPEVISEMRSMLRSASTYDVRFAVPRRSSCTRLGDRTFCVTEPTAWNSLPESIRVIPKLDSFKRQLTLWTSNYFLPNSCRRQINF